MSEGTGPAEGGSELLDAEAVLSFAERLRDLAARVEDADVPEPRRQRWERKLLDLAEAGRRDLGEAEAQLRRFEARVSGEL